MKGYTDLSQSKKLTEILPIESADMTYCAITEGMREKMIIKDWKVNISLDIAIKENLFSYKNGYMIPCWSLTALFGVLPDELEEGYYLTLNKEGKEYCCCYEDINGNSFRHTFADNPVDACVAMIEKLHELKML